MSSSYGQGYGRSFEAYPRSQNMFSMLTAKLDPVVQKHLRRVYTSLFLALASATVGSLLTIQLYARRLYWPATLASYLTLPILLAFSFQSPYSKWRAPLLYAFAFVDGAAAAPLLSLVSTIDPRIPALAFMGAAVVFACCTISAIFARRGSYLCLGSICSTALFGIFLVSLISSFWNSMAAFSLIMYGGLLAFVGFVLYDTQLIIQKAHSGERDHIQHALELFVDFLAIFKRLAIIMANNQRQRQRREQEEKS